MTPTHPGRWSCRIHGERDVIYHVDHLDGVLSVVFEEGAPHQMAPSPVSQLTEFLEQMGWGSWVGRVGDLPSPSTASPLP